MNRKVIQWLRGAMPPRGAARVLTVNAFVGSVGTGLFLTGSVLYYTRVIHLSVTRVGLGLSLAGVCAVLATVPAGMLADRIGPRRWMVGLHAWRVLAYGALAFVSTYWEFLIAVVAATAADRLGPPTNQALVGTIFTKAERLRTMAFLRAVRNIGLGLGALLAGLALQADTPVAYRLLVLGNAVSFVPMMFLIASLRKYERSAPTAPAAGDAAAAPAGSSPAGASATRLPAIPFLTLSALNGVMLLHDSILFIALPLWIADDTAAPHFMIAVVMIINTAFTALSQVRWTRWTQTLPKASRSMLTCATLLASSALIFGVAKLGDAAVAASCLVAGAIIFTAGENLHSAASWQVSYDLSPADAQAKYLAIFSLGATGQDIFGPTLATVLAVATGVVGWLAIAAIFLATGAGSRACIQWNLAAQGRDAAEAPALSPSGAS